jgi:hypothetical protein
METKLRDLAGCWIEARCANCGWLKGHPVRMLLTERRERADMALRRAVDALGRCEACGQGVTLALVSDPRWRVSRAAGKPPNWSMTLTGRGRGTVAFTDYDSWPYGRK